MMTDAHTREELEREIKRLRTAIQEIHTFAGYNRDAYVMGTYIRQIRLMLHAALNPKGQQG